MALTFLNYLHRKLHAILQPPVRAGGELKVIEAAQALRAQSPNATLIFYYAIDYARTWYDLGRWFDEHPQLEVHDADGRRANDYKSPPGKVDYHVTGALFDCARVYGDGSARGTPFADADPPALEAAMLERVSPGAGARAAELVPE